MSEDVRPYGAGDERDDNAAARLKELRALTEKLAISQRGIARELEVDERTVRYWFSGQYPTPLSAIYALRYLVTSGGARLARTQEAPRAMRSDAFGEEPKQHVVDKSFLVRDPDGADNEEN